jgi:hypothetical protein
MAGRMVGTISRSRQRRARSTEVSGFTAARGHRRGITITPPLSRLIADRESSHGCHANIPDTDSVHRRRRGRESEAPQSSGLKCDTITSPKRLVNTFIHQMIPDLLKRDKPIKVAINFKSWSTTRDISSEWG